MGQNIGQDAPIAFVVDGVPYSNSLLFDQPLFDLQQIEVMRGPQGALYGRNSVGGAINITTQRPTNNLEGNIKLHAGQRNDYSVETSISGPIVKDKLLFRATGAVSTQDGLFKNVITGENLDAKERAFGKLRLLWTPTDNIEVDLRGSGQISHESSTRHVAVNTGFSDPSATEGAPLLILDPRGQTGPAEGNYGPGPGNTALLFNDGTVHDMGGNLISGYNFAYPTAYEPGIQISHMPRVTNKYYSVSGKIDAKFDWGTFTSITDYTQTRLQGLTIINFHYLAPIVGEIKPEDSIAYSEEIRLTSPANQRLRWIVGGFYQHQDRNRQINLYLNFPGLYANGGCCAIPPFVQIPEHQQNTVWAPFAQLSYDISDALELNVAGRYDSDHREQLTAGLQKTFTSFQPKVTLKWKITPDHLLYATYSKGFRSGGFNSGAAPQLEYGKETLFNYELGFKSNWADNRLQFNAAVYYLDLKNQQYFLFTPAAGQFLLNADKAKATGVDLELNARPTKGLTISAGLSYQNTKVTDYGSIILDTGPVSAYNGGKFIYTPEYSANISAQYEHSVTDDVSMVYRVDYQRKGKMYFGIDNAVVARQYEYQPAYDLVNLRLALRTDKWTLSGYVDNALDKTYYAHGWLGRFIGQEAGGLTPGQPRHWGMEYEVKF
jgi:iron complex outermembrane receptor protein